MFNVTGGEVVLMLIVALVVLGPDKLPEMLRKVGRVYGEVRKMANGFQSEFRDAFEEPIREFREAAESAFQNPLSDATSTEPSVPAISTVDPTPGPTPDDSASAAPGSPWKAPDAGERRNPWAGQL